MSRILIISANFYRDIVDALLEGAMVAFDAAGMSVETVEVPGALEVPAAIAMAADTGRYDGYVALGCVIRGETSHYDTVCEESAHGLNLLAIQRRLAISNGILTVENQEQAMDRAMVERKNKGGGAAEACIAMLRLKQRMRVN